MKYPSGNSSTLFCEQVSTVTSLFEKWNDCERTVVIYALLKRLRYSNLKFLQYSIENNLSQNSGLQSHMTTFDINANSPLHLQNLISAYKSFQGIEMAEIADREPIYFGSDFVFKNDGKVYSKKEDILTEILGMLPLLKPGNDEAKLIYLSIIPIAVEDTVRQIVSTELVQQIFSYLLIHPAISNEDRRSLSHWLRHLEDHIQSSFASAGQQSFYVLSNNTGAYLSNSSTSMSSSVGSVASRNAWQAIAPPQPSAHKNPLQSLPTVVSNKSEWNVTIPNISDNLCDNFNGIKINELGSSQNSLGLCYNGTTNENCSFGSNGQLDVGNINNITDDHHTSFSKNGTEISDFDSKTCESCSCAQMNFPSLLNNCDHLNDNRWSLDSRVGSIKTRRSNSLTTAVSSVSSANASDTAGNDNCSNSSENLAQFAQKPRSFSLSIENPRTTLISSGSDTRLDDMKPNYLKFTSHNSGMSNIGQWLKSLRLHKYIDLFKNITYEAMLEITEDYLQDLGVTKGASHKLALCIEKLNDRGKKLINIEQDLVSGQIRLNFAIEELAGIVLTPMQPADSSTENVAYKFIKVIELICSSMIQKDSFCLQDEENVSALLWILERAIHGEAFTTHINQLKEMKLQLSKLKSSFVPKGNSNVSLNKPRWSCKTRKIDQKNGSNDRINRKNSNDMFNISVSCLQQHAAPMRNTINKSSCGNTGSCSQYKSSSYPNFINGGAIPNQLFHQTKTPANHQGMMGHQKQFTSLSTQHGNHQQHRRSLNNLIVVSTGQGSSNICADSSSIFSKSNLSQINDERNRKQSISYCSSPRNQQSSDMHQKQTRETKKPLEKTMAAVVLVSNKNGSELGGVNSIENNNNALNVKNDNQVFRGSVCSSSQSYSSILSNSICSAITNNLFASPTSSLLLRKEKYCKNNNISDIKSLEQLEFLCLQMTEQAIN